MGSVYVWLSAVLLSVSVRGFTYSENGWTMTVADVVSVEEGGSAVLPCIFKHPNTNLTVTGSVKWFNSYPEYIFQCTYLGTDHPHGELCESGKQQDGGSRFRFAGNLSNKDGSILMEQLSRAESDTYHCQVDLNVGTFKSPKETILTVKDASGNDSVVIGTERASVMLPCMFTPSHAHTLTTVSWMRKEPYQHVVTFRAQSNGLWTTENGENRYEFIGSPKEGNASIKIKQLSVNDNYTYLCLVEYTSPNYQYLILNETHLQIIHAAETFPIVILCIPLGVKLLPLLVMWIVLYKDRTRKEQDRSNTGS